MADLVYLFGPLVDITTCLGRNTGASPFTPTVLYCALVDPPTSTNGIRMGMSVYLRGVTQSDLCS